MWNKSVVLPAYMNTEILQCDS